MSKKKERIRRGSVVVVDLKEIEWIKVLEISVPSFLIWIAYINMLHPVQIDRHELGILIHYVREHAGTVTAPRERRALERIANKMAKALSAPATRARLRSDSRYVPNNRQSAIRKAGDCFGVG